MSERKAKEPSPRKSVAREYFESIVVAIILALFVRTFAVQAFKIPTGSMETNLLIGDHLLVNKLVYSPSAGPLEDRLFGKKKIERGHVVVFKFPEEPERDFIKRVIALPGENVEIRNKKVYIDGEPLEEPYVHFLRPPRPEEAVRDPLVDSETDDWGPKVVPPGQLLVLGDNRDNSRDSRFWGFLPVDQVKGRALIVYWSYEATREEYTSRGRNVLENVWIWIKDMARLVWNFRERTRWGRFFHLIR
jgi:signal peptidase I